MALENSAEALVRYLEQVKQHGSFNTPHGETLFVNPLTLEKYLDQVVDDLFSLHDAAKIVITAGKPVPK